MQRTDFAPVLSATSSRDSVWIISNIPNLYPRPGLGALASDQSWARRRRSEPLTAISIRRICAFYSAARDYMAKPGCPVNPATIFLDWPRRLTRQGEVQARQFLESAHLRVGPVFLLKDGAHLAGQ